MSPSRTRKPVAHLRSRSEIVVAVAVGAGIVLATVFLVWAMRPGKPGAQGTGGIMSRQPRVSMFLVLAALVFFAAIMWVLRGRRRPKRVNARTAVLLTVIVVSALVVLASIFWPGGLVHHWPAQPKVETPPSTSPATSPPTTLLVGTTAHPGTTVNGAPTTKPASTPTTTPATIPPTTTKSGTPTTKGA